MPYAGAIRAQGRTAAEIQAAIVAALKDRALEPQAVVTLTDQRASSITVLGDAVGSIRFPASASGERILDAIARAGLKSPGFDLWVMLERNGRRETVPFGALIYEPENNIYVRPRDTIFIYSEPQTFLAFGATGSQALSREAITDSSISAPGEFRLPKPWLKRVALLTHRPILHRYSFIEARRAKSHSCLESTVGHILDRLFRLFTISICAIRQAFSWPQSSK